MVSDSSAARMCVGCRHLYGISCFRGQWPSACLTQCDELMEALNELRVSCQSLSLALDLHRHLCVDRSPRHVSLRELILERNAT